MLKSFLLHNFLRIKKIVASCEEDEDEDKDGNDDEEADVDKGRIGMRELMLMRINMKIGMTRIIKLSLLNILKLLLRSNKVICLSVCMNVQGEDGDDNKDEDEDKNKDADVDDDYHGNDDDDDDE